MGRVGLRERIKYFAIIFPSFFFPSSVLTRRRTYTLSLPHHTLSKMQHFNNPVSFRMSVCPYNPSITRSQKRVSRLSCRLCARTMYCSHSSRLNTAAAVTYNDTHTQTRASPLVVRDMGRSPRMYMCLSFPAALVSKSSREY